MRSQPESRGAGAKNIAILLYSILKEEQKTKGKARLTNMIHSGKELKVFTIKSGDLKKFTQEAKKYGVLYCVLADRGNKDPNAEVDVIARDIILTAYLWIPAGKRSVVPGELRDGNGVTACSGLKRN